MRYLMLYQVANEAVYHCARDIKFLIKIMSRLIYVYLRLYICDILVISVVVMLDPR